MDRIAVYVLAVVVVLSGTMKGYLAHRFAVKRWPELDAALPVDVGAIGGALAGVTVAALWLALV